MSDYGDKPFGLADVKIVPLPSGTVVDLPVSRTLKFKERVRSAELQGDDKIASVVTIAEAVEWELEAGGISLEAYAALTGRTVTTSGSTPNRTVTLAGAAQHAYPYVKIYGKVLGEGTDDVHCKIFKAKVTDGLEGSFQHGEFFVTSCKGVAVDDGVNGIFEFVQNETATALPAS